MKLALLSILICASSVFSTEIKSQNARVTISVTDKEIKNVIDEIENQTDYLFIYNAKKVDLNKKCSIDVEEETVKEVLTDVFSDSDIVYAVEGTNIMLMKKEKLVKAIPQIVQKEERFLIKGKVIDNKGLGVPGVTILVDGSTRGVVTDIDGTFSIDVLVADKLQFSFIGMESQMLAAKKDMIVVMQELTDVLEDVTVVAFARQKKESVIGSVTTVNPGDLKVPSSNLTTAFAGRIAGLISYQRTGEPGEDNADFFIRGITTFGDAGRSNPLILIDDVELSTDDLARLHPDDIASFSVLKDATATALYGARGANGVILVTTKMGKEGKVSVSFRYETSISAPVSDTKMADPITFMKLHNEAVRTRDKLAILPYLDADIAAREQRLNPYVYPIVDWKEMLFKDFTNNHRANLNLSGGGKVSNYYIALSYARDNGILDVDPMNNFNNNIQLDKFSMRTNVNIKLSKTSKIAVRLTGTFDNYQGPLTGGADIYRYAVKANPVLFPATFAPDEETAHLNHVLFGNYGVSGGEYMNPYAQMLKGYKQSQNTLLIAQMDFNQDLKMITKGLNLRVLGSTTRNSYFDLTRQYTPFWYTVGMYDKVEDDYQLVALNPDKGTDYLDYKPGGKKVASSLMLEARLSYSKTFAEKHSVSGLLVYTATDKLDGNAETLINSLAGRNLKLAGRFTYGFDERYYVEGNFGYNGSERFNQDHRWGFFPSAGIGWVVSKEKFWENSSFLYNTFQLFKFKSSYGLVGNDNISKDRFFYLSEVNMNDGNKSHTFGDEFGNTKNGISIKRYADDQIGWEISHKLNIGLEMRVFDALDIQVEYFTEKRTNILQERTDIPTVIGLQSTPKANIGEAKGSGFDMSLNYQKSFNEDLWLSAMANLTFASSEFSVYEEPDYSQTTPWLSKVGSKLSQPRGLIAERLFVDEYDVVNSPQQMFGEYMAGDIKYKDINGDNIINSLDVVPIGYPETPEFIYGFGFSAGYKGIDFSCFFQGSARSTHFVDPATVAPFINSLKEGKGNNGVLEFIANDHWSEENQNAYAAWPRLSNYKVENNNQKSTWFMHSGNFLRLKSLELGYTIPEEITRKAKVEKLRVYLSGTNLFNISSFDLWDPEMGGSGFTYPIQRVFNIGVQLNF